MKENGTYDWLNHLPIYVMKSGLPLFHVTPFNIPWNQDEERPWLAALEPGAWTTDLTRPVYFSLSEEHTIYYDSWDDELDQWRSAHLSYVSSAPLKLIDFGKIHLRYDLEMQTWLIEKGIDGWIHYDEPTDPWREILLFEPNENVEFLTEIIHDYELFRLRKSWDIYPVPEKDQRSLNKYCIGRHELADLIIP